LDKQGDRLCRPGKRCTWLDLNKNKHDLDLVLERGRSADKPGIPAAFIETAWRRYTKHSRNKAPRNTGAIVPFSLEQRHIRIDASSEENTADADFRKKVNSYEALTPPRCAALARGFLREQREDVEQFMVALEILKWLFRDQIDRVTVIPLHGSATELANVGDAIKFIHTYGELAGNNS
jgi:hypothetical protein